MQKDHVIEHRRPGLVVMQKESSKFQVVDLVILHDKGVNIKQIKITNYQDLVWEILWNMPVKVIYFVMGDKEIVTNIEQLQKSTLLHMTKVLQRVVTCCYWTSRQNYY